MSIDYSIYLKQATAFSAESFENYCSSLGLCAAFHPTFRLLENSGFVPMRLMDERFAKDGENTAFLTGFELYSSDYHHVAQPQKKRSGFFHKLFKAKPVEETPFDKAIKDCTLSIDLRCSIADSFEVLMAYALGAYLVKFCGGVFDDPQTGQFYDDYSHLEAEIAAIVTELLELADTGELLTHEFKEWDEDPS